MSKAGILKSWELSDSQRHPVDYFLGAGAILLLTSSLFQNIVSL
jgi:hypothetical protein